MCSPIDNIYGSTLTALAPINRVSW